MQVSVVGLGAMGGGLARRLIEAGHTVTVWNRTAEPVQPLVALGAVAAHSVETALRSPIVISMLANDAAVLEVFTSDALASAGSDTLHINMATLGIDAVRALIERHYAAGIGYLAAPVLGRPVAAAAGQLHIITAGDASLVSRAQPVFDVLGKRTWNMGGDPIRANLVKIAVNFNLIHALEALGESVALVEAGGVNAEDFVELLTNSLFEGIAYTGYGNAIAKQQYYPAGFTVALGLKDLGLVEDVSHELGVTLPTVPKLRDVFEATLANPELKDADWAAIAEVSRGSRARDGND